MSAEQEQPQVQQQTTTEPAPQKDAGFFVPSKDEWVDFRREVRQLKESLRGKEAAPSPAPDAGKSAPSGDVGVLTQRFNALESELQFERAVGRSGMQFSADQRSLLESAYHHQRPAAETLNDWLSRTAQTMGVKPGQAAPPPVPADPPRNKGADNNTGAPARTPEGGKGDPRIFAVNNAEAWARMDPAERNQWVRDFEAQSGRLTTPITPAHLRLSK